MNILVDMDGVIADFETEFLKRWRANHPDKSHVEKKDRRGLWLREQYPLEYREFVEEIYHAPGFYYGLPPIEGALDALNYMIEQGHNVRICTSPMLPKYENCVLEKYHWLADNLGSAWVERMVMTKDKTMVRGDILIDDMPEIKGSLEPVWEHVLYTQPYNQDITHKRRITWESFKEVLSL